MHTPVKNRNEVQRFGIVTSLFSEENRTEKKNILLSTTVHLYQLPVAAVQEKTFLCLTFSVNDKWGNRTDKLLMIRKAFKIWKTGFFFF